MIIFHRGLQNIKVNRKIYKELKEKEHLLAPFQPKSSQTSQYDTKMQAEISKAYSLYLKAYVNVNNKTDILSKAIKNISDDIADLKTASLLQNGLYFATLIDKIFE